MLGTLLVPCLVSLSVDRTWVSPQQSMAQWEKDCWVKSAMEVRVHDARRYSGLFTTTAAVNGEFGVC